jgi:hypothetical protein
MHPQNALICVLRYSMRHDRNGSHSVFTLGDLGPREAKIACSEDVISNITKYTK